MPDAFEVPSPAPAPARTRPRVLVVDDHEAGRRGLARYLAAEGFEVVTAADGASALEALAHGPELDFLLTDLRLPDLDGLEIVHAARQLGRPLHVALITGFLPEASPEDLARWGVDRTFDKPLNLPRLSEELRQEWDRRARESPSQPP